MGGRIRLPINNIYNAISFLLTDEIKKNILKRIMASFFEMAHDHNVLGTTIIIRNHDWSKTNVNIINLYCTMFLFVFGDNIIFILYNCGSV